MFLHKLYSKHVIIIKYIFFLNIPIFYFKKNFFLILICIFLVKNNYTAYFPKVESKV